MMNDYQDTNPPLPGLLADFLTRLRSADALRTHDSPLLTEWDTSEITGDPHSEIVHLRWEDEEHGYAVSLTEGAIAAGRWEDNTFHCLDSEGDELSVTLYRLSPVSRSPAS